jgi:hypothetical protein
LALSDPQTVTIGSAQTLARILTGSQEATYADPTGMFTLRVTHLVTKTRKRSLVQVLRKKISTDALTDLKSEVSAWLSITFDRPLAGFTEAELLELEGVFTWLTASTNANAKKVLALES